MEGSHTGAVCRNLKKIMEDCFPWEGSHAGAGEEREKEEAAEVKCDELTTAPLIPHLPVTEGRRVLFSLPSPAEEGVMEELGRHLASSQPTKIIAGFTHLLC